MANSFDEVQVQDERQSGKHRTDSLTILMFLSLLALVILTIWLFKHRRLRFVHETGLAMIYGLLVGAIIRYTTEPGEIPRAYMGKNSTLLAAKAPDSVLIGFKESTNSTEPEKLLQYDLFGEVRQVEDMLERTVSFNPELFFNVFLPLIIFNAGYNMKRKHFFRNIGAIMAYAFLGTTISCIIVGGIMYGLTRFMAVTFTFTDSVFFGAIISATDPVTVLAIFHDLNVDVDLYAIVFGESVLNDAVAIVLSKAIEKYGENSQSGFEAGALFGALGIFVGTFTGSFAIGSFMGCITAILTKFTKIRDYPILETSLFVVMSYSTFEAAEAADLTGIVAVLFCGITQAHYTYNNLSQQSKDWTKQFFELLNFLSENFVFLYIGVSVFTLQLRHWHAGFIFAGFLAILVGRVFNVYPISFVLNLFRKNKLRWNLQHMMMFAGLRGAIAFALAVRNTASEARELMLTTTMMIVLGTVILCGGFTTPMLQWLQIKVGVDHDQDAGERGDGDAKSSSIIDPVRSGQPQILQPSSRRHDKAWMAKKWHGFDIRYMKPLLTNARPTLIETLPRCCVPLAKLLTTEEQLSQGSDRGDNDSDTDIIIDPEDQLSYGEPVSVASISTVQDNANTVPKQNSIQELDEAGDWDGENNHSMKLELQIPGAAGSRV